MRVECVDGLESSATDRTLLVSRTTLTRVFASPFPRAETILVLVLGGSYKEIKMTISNGNTRHKTVAILFTLRHYRAVESLFEDSLRYNLL